MKKPKGAPSEPHVILLVNRRKLGDTIKLLAARAFTMSGHPSATTKVALSQKFDTEKAAAKFAKTITGHYLGVPVKLSEVQDIPE